MPPNHRILHICNDFAGSKVHSNLVHKLDDMGLRQAVYCPVRQKDLLGRNRFESERTDIAYSFVIKPWYKFCYYHKRRMLYQDMKRHISLADVSLIHASTLFSDGGLAYNAHREFGIPYVVAVRSTDVDDFGRLMPHTWPSARRILMAAERIYFISEALRREFKSLPWVHSLWKKIRDKCILRPNGIDDFWLQHVRREQPRGQGIIYLGELLHRKNIVRLIEAVQALREESPFADLTLTLIGKQKGDKPTEEAMRLNRDFVVYHEPIYDKPMLMDYLRRAALFAMPSWDETFGLVYVEALSQNLPILYSRGTGVDGMFGEQRPVGVGVESHSVEQIREALREMLTHPERYSNAQVDFSRFEWSGIAESYLKDYVEILSSD